MPLDSTNWPTTETAVDETTALLIRARSFLERGWCRDVFARNATGRVVPPRHQTAVAWCAIGALLAAGMPEPRIVHVVHSMHPAMRRLKSAVGGWNVGRFNNTQETVEPVLAAFDRAIADRIAA